MPQSMEGYLQTQHPSSPAEAACHGDRNHELAEFPIANQILIVLLLAVFHLLLTLLLPVRFEEVVKKLTAFSCGRDINGEGVINTLHCEEALQWGSACLSRPWVSPYHPNFVVKVGVFFSRMQAFDGGKHLPDGKMKDHLLFFSPGLG